VREARAASDKVERVQVHKLLDTALSYCEHVLSHHGISVERQYQTVPEVAGIKANLAQVFVNVITNACQAMCPGGVLQMAVARAGPSVAVPISDPGPGMDPATLRRGVWAFFSPQPQGRCGRPGLFFCPPVLRGPRGG